MTATEKKRQELLDASEKVFKALHALVSIVTDSFMADDAAEDAIRMKLEDFSYRIIVTFDR